MVVDSLGVVWSPFLNRISVGGFTRALHYDDGRGDNDDYAVMYERTTYGRIKQT